MHSLTCITRLFSKRMEKRVESLKKDFQKCQRETLGSNTSREKSQSSYHLLMQRIPNKTLKEFKDMQKKLKERKLNKKGIKMLTKLKHQKQEKHL